MKLALASLALSALLAATAMPRHASAQSSQQDRMKTCNAQAGTQKLGGDARKSFMSDCLSGKPAATPAAAAPMTPQERMKSCNTQAAGMKGDDRKTFMTTCLHG